MKDLENNKDIHLCKSKGNYVFIKKYIYSFLFISVNFVKILKSKDIFDYYFFCFRYLLNWCY